jgi:hypothetical protein
MILVALFLFVPLLLAVSRLDAIAAVPLALLPVMQGSQLLGGHFATAVTSFVFVLLLPDVTVRRVVHMFPVWKTNIASLHLCTNSTGRKRTSNMSKYNS